MNYAAIERRVDPWGRTIFHGEDAVELLLRGGDITAVILEPTAEIDEYNRICVEHDKLEYVINVPPDPPLSPHDDTEQRQAIWRIPLQYQTLDVRRKLISLCEDQTEIDRVTMEMTMFERRGLLPVLQLMCYLVDRWRSEGVVWGVGRGSSVASYCLFLIGVHCINPLRYNLDIREFLK